MDYTSYRWIKLTKKAKRRDKYLCQRCLRYGRHSDAQMVHHIVSPLVKPERAYDLTNLQCLCLDCHNVIHSEKGGSRPGYVWK